MSYQCPVCGYDQLTRPPENFLICSSCGTEFGNDDFDQSHSALRSDWIEKDMPWFSRSTFQPRNWNPYRQLIIADYGEDLIAHPRFANDVNYKYAVNKAFSEVNIAKQLRHERESEHLTQSQLAARADMKQSRISELEGMDYSSWSISTLERLAKALGVAFVYSFITWEELVSRIRSGQPTVALPPRVSEHVPASVSGLAHALSSQAAYGYQVGVTTLGMLHSQAVKEEKVVSMERHKQWQQILDDENSRKQKQQRDAATLSYSDTALAG